MNLQLLRVFVAVVDARSFSRAAQALGVSQPAVSKSVRELESQLETVLLERQGRAFEPNEAGRVLYDYGRSIFALEREAQEAISAFYDLERGRLTIGASTTIATYWLPPYLVEFRRRHPHLDVVLQSANTQQIIERLIDCELDVALVEGHVADPRVEARRWLNEEMVVVAPGRSHGSESMAKRPLGQQVWVVREQGSGSREATDALLARLGHAQPATIEVGSNEAVVQTVAAGGGLGLVPRVCARDQLEFGRVQTVQLTPDPIRRQLYRVRLPHRVISHAALAFEALIAESD
ncbi:DNA-binding transcriptional LysR family regulator [Alkalispirillum mobile]|uniref:DNA-binding transcriptional LysR family regulator n=1 Tax=Alkalispirillum mobile TaxID=85925 RepID=A0A498C9F9_9GAMM|nr:LysR substrate-binding domain-containing protein [Alkalispirillum mobile]RLK50926.1 DNA-binding transcriptional LysR family regulator [Alkalispirillum mobile]